jgi:hypothetical protein
VLVAQPDFDQRGRVKLATALALAQLRQDLVGENGQQLPSLTPIVKQRDDVGIEACGVEGLRCKRSSPGEPTTPSAAVRSIGPPVPFLLSSSL